VYLTRVKVFKKIVKTLGLLAVKIKKERKAFTYLGQNTKEEGEQYRQPCNMVF
jgi:hypothetical protein